MILFSNFQAKEQILNQELTQASTSPIKTHLSGFSGVGRRVAELGQDLCVRLVDSLEFGLEGVVQVRESLLGRI